ncbi:MAG: molybdopterin-dependent oxidoreductase [Acidimicrobiia bacterium]|nr:molybdopterin-dependent oxidoreductase [Acidimicrobiia bacterium]
MSTTTRTRVKGGIGESVTRPDGVPKVQGDFAYASDLQAEGMLWGATRRSPHPFARITAIDIAPALAIAGVFAVLTHDDVPGRPTVGQIKPDRPVLAGGEVRYWGQPIAITAAADAETARRAAAAIVIEYELLEPLTDLVKAQEQGEVFRHVRSLRGEPDSHGEIVVEGYYEMGTQDQAALGTEAGIAFPDGEGGVDLFAPSQWIHEDHGQIVASLGLRDEQVRVHPAGVGGAFGSREDLSLQVHLCLLALYTGRPVRMVYDRQESFAGHVHRHAARMWYRHEADSQGNLIRVEAKLLLDGGAYTETSPAVIANAVYFSIGPYRCPNVVIDGYAVRTNNPPSGAMRGFGAVQTCFAYEAQMDRLAAEIGIDPLELRLRNALGPGDQLPTSGQVITEPLPTVEVINVLRALPAPDLDVIDDPLHLPGGTGLTTTREGVVRGVGYAVGLKNLAFAEAFDDYAEARVVLTPQGVEVHTAAIEVGQGMVTVLQQIARSVLGTEHVVVLFDDTSRIGSAGSTSASRQTQMAGGAVFAAASAVRRAALQRVGGDDMDAQGVRRGGSLVATVEDLCAAGPVEETVRFRHPDTEEPDENGQGNLHVDFSVAAHRAVVDVDPELGLVRVVSIDAAQEVGTVLNPQSVVGQIEGGTMQGLGLAIMEELIFDKGIVRNANFTDYLLPTFLDAPPIASIVIEEPGNWGPFGAKGFSELPAISSGPAVMAAIRAATNQPLTRMPVRPEDIALSDS